MHGTVPRCGSQREQLKHEHKISIIAPVLWNRAGRTEDGRKYRMLSSRNDLIQRNTKPSRILEFYCVFHNPLLGNYGTFYSIHPKNVQFLKVMYCQRYSFLKVGNYLKVQGNPHLLMEYISIHKTKYRY